MKTQISRVSHRPERRYSGVYQQMGRMKVDADENEGMDIIRALLSRALDDVVHDGAPREGGVVDFDQAPPVVRFGRAYADGIGADLVPTDVAGPAGDVYHDQADFPFAPARPAGPHVLYLDVWNREVGALEDEDLLDPALHGADTTTRTQTMAQLKWCAAPADGEAPACEDDAANPRMGDADLTAGLRERAATTAPDPCDPCADTLDLDAAVGNYLFRLEVHDVEGPADAPTAIALKWSSENGAEQHRRRETPIGFASADFVYEPYDIEDEKHLGVHLSNWRPTREDLVAAPPTSGKEFVRRWDGCCRLERDDDTWSLDGGSLAVDRGTQLTEVASPQQTVHGSVHFGDRMTINLRALRLSLALADRSFVVGDHWLVLVRERAPAPADSDDAGEDERVRVLSEGPLGISHHYLTLGRFANGGLELDPDARRKLGFPPLTDVHASDVRYEGAGCDLLGLATTVQQALDAVCDIGAQHVGYAAPQGCASPLLVGATTVKKAIDAFCGLKAEHIPYQTDCPTLLGAKNVDEALDLLCKESEHGKSFCSALLRLFGRGVLCGLLPQVSAAHAIGRDPEDIELTVQVSAGTVVDGRGCVVRLTEDLELITPVEALSFGGFVDRPAADDIFDRLRALREGTGDAPLSAAKRRLITDRRMELVREQLADTPFGSAQELQRMLGERTGISDEDVLAAMAREVVDAAEPVAEPKAVHFWLYLVSSAAGESSLALRSNAPSKLQLTEAVKGAVGRPQDGPVVDPGATCSQAHEQAWRMYREVPCPDGNGDGAVCLARVGVSGTRAWTSPDDREQLFPTPAIEAALWRAQRRPVYDAVQAACLAEAPKPQRIELGGATLDGMRLFATGAQLTGTVVLDAVVRGAAVTVQLSASSGVELPASPVVVIAPGEPTGTFSWRLTAGARGEQTITATLGASTHTAGFTAVALDALQRFDGQPLHDTTILTGASVSARVPLSGAAPAAADIAMSADTGLTVQPIVKVDAGATVSPDFTVESEFFVGGSFVVRAKLGGMTVSATVHVAKPDKEENKERPKESKELGKDIGKEKDFATKEQGKDSEDVERLQAREGPEGLRPEAGGAFHDSGTGVPAPIPESLRPEVGADIFDDPRDEDLSP